MGKNNVFTIHQLNFDKNLFTICKNNNQLAMFVVNGYYIFELYHILSEVYYLKRKYLIKKSTYKHLCRFNTNMIFRTLLRFFTLIILM